MRAIFGVGLLIAIAGCGVNPLVDLGAHRTTGPAPRFDDCVANDYLYIGETRWPLGLDAVTRAPIPAADANRVDTIWVTADFFPCDHSMDPGGGDIEMVRMFCVEFPDGSGMSSWPVDETWRPPSAAPVGEADDSDPSPPMGLLLVAIGAVLLLGFR